jgi:hypothetical protein
MNKIGMTEFSGHDFSVNAKEERGKSNSSATVKNPSKQKRHSKGELQEVSDFVSLLIHK